MKREAWVYAISCTCFGILIGWILGSQRAAPLPAPAATAPAADASQTGEAQPPPLDLQKASDLERLANGQPSDVAIRVELGNLYFDARRFDLAMPWYEAALKLNPRDVDVSTDLAVCYYSTGQIDRGLVQIDNSLVIDPKHAKTLLNQGIMRQWGKQDRTGAAESWRKVIAVAPGSQEAQMAQQGLDGITNAHGTGDAGASRGGRGGRP